MTWMIRAAPCRTTAIVPHTRCALSPGLRGSDVIATPFPNAHSNFESQSIGVLQIPPIVQGLSSLR